jgi:hypothetical protein
MALNSTLCLKGGPINFDKRHYVTSCSNFATPSQRYSYA